MIARCVTRLSPYKKKFDSVVATGLSGVIIGAQVAEKLKKNFVVVRKPSEKSHGDTIEAVGDIGRYIIFDDFIATGATIKRVKKVLDASRIFNNSVCVGVYLWSDDSFCARASVNVNIPDLTAPTLSLK